MEIDIQKNGLNLRKQKKCRKGNKKILKNVLKSNIQIMLNSWSMFTNIKDKDKKQN